MAKEKQEWNVNYYSLIKKIKKRMDAGMMSEEEAYKRNRFLEWSDEFKKMNKAKFDSDTEDYPVKVDKEHREIADRIYQKYMDEQRKIRYELYKKMKAGYYPPYELSFDCDEKTDEMTRVWLRGRYLMVFIMTFLEIENHALKITVEDRSEDFDDGKNHLITKIEICF